MYSNKGLTIVVEHSPTPPFIHLLANSFIKMIKFRYC